MSVFRFFVISAVLLCLVLPAYADVAVPQIDPPVAETEPAIPDAPILPDTSDALPGYMGEQKPEFPGMEAPSAPQPVTP